MNISELEPFFQLNSETCCACLKQENLHFVTENKLLHDIFIKLTDTQVEQEKKHLRKICTACSRKLEIISNVIYSLKNQFNSQLQAFERKSCCKVCFNSETVTTFPQHLFDLFQKMIDFQLMFKCTAIICNKCLNMLEEISTFVKIIQNNEQSREHIVTIKQELIDKPKYKLLEEHLKPNDKQALKIEIKEEITQDEDGLFGETPEIKTEPNGFFNDYESNNFTLKSEDSSNQVVIEDDLHSESWDNPETVLKMEIGDEGLQYNYKENIPIDCTVCNRSFETTSGLLNHLKHKLRCRYQTKFIAQFWKSFLKKVAKPFKCQVCLKYFSSVHQKDKHTKTHFGKVCVLCIFCGKAFIKPKEYLQHYRHHLTKQFPIKCKTCPRRFPTKMVYVKHLTKHKDFNKKQYRCKICYCTHSKKSLLVNHMKRDKVTCPYCTKIFCKKSDLVNHLRSHTGEKPFQCAVCSWRFSFKGNLTKHSRIHTGYKPHLCKICLKSFSRPDYLKSHYAGVHKKETGILICCKKKNNKKLITKAQFQFICNICNKVCSSKTSLTSHTRVHNRKDAFQCTVCDKSFRYKGLLNGHMKIHLNYRPYVCTMCPKTFIKRNDLTRHTKTHTKEKNFKCEICHDKFSRKDVLRLHLRGHTGQRPYECENCLKTFVQKSNLTHHLKKCKAIFEIDVIN